MDPRAAESRSGGRPSEQPLALQMLESGYIDQQDRSPLFGTIPKELRDIIFEYALLAFADPHRLYSNNELFARPGVAGHRRIAVELLLTCKAVYVETYQLPITLNPVIAHFGGPERIPPHARNGLQNLAKLSSWQFAALHTLDITTQQVHLEGTSLSDCARGLQAAARFDKARARATLQDADNNDSSAGASRQTTEGPSQTRRSGLEMPSKDPNVPRIIDKLIIRLGRTEWWTWESTILLGQCSFPDNDTRPQLALDPGYGMGWSRGPNCISRAVMLREATKRKNGEWNGWPPNRKCWGAQVADFKGLRELELVLETFACKADQLDVVVECAKLWTFPMGDGFELRWDGEVEKDQWFGVDGYGYEEKNTWLRTPPMFVAGTGAFVNAEATRTSSIMDWRSSPIPDQRQFDIRIIRFKRTACANES